MSATRSRSPDWDGYGEDWEELSSATLQRDSYTCQRCFRDNGVLQAHHIIPRAEGGPDELSNLITVCQPCHAVQHPENPRFDESRPDAPLFPDPDAHESVAWMRLPEHYDCTRCNATLEHPEEIVAYRYPEYDGSISLGKREYPATLCKPCAGVLVNQRPSSKQHLSAQQRLRVTELTDRAEDAEFRPVNHGRAPIHEWRAPQTLREQLYWKIPAWWFVSRFLALLVVGGLVYAIT